MNISWSWSLYQHCLRSCLAWWPLNKYSCRGLHSSGSTTDLREDSIYLQPSEALHGLLEPTSSSESITSHPAVLIHFIPFPTTGVHSSASVSILDTVGMKPTAGYDRCYRIQQSKFNLQNFLQPHFKISCSQTSNTFWEHWLFTPQLFIACLCAQYLVRRNAHHLLKWISSLRWERQPRYWGESGRFSWLWDLVLGRCCRRRQLMKGSATSEARVYGAYWSRTLYWSPHRFQKTPKIS